MSTVLAWVSGVITRRLARASRLLLLLALLGAVSPRVLPALTYSFVTKPDQDNLSIVFERPGVFPTIVRTGPRQITLTFPAGTVTPPPEDRIIDFRQSRFIQGVAVSGNTAVVTLNTDQFGFVGWPSGEEALKLQIYRDPLGADWKPEAPPSPPNAPAPAGAAKGSPETPPLPEEATGGAAGGPVAKLKIELPPGLDRQEAGPPSGQPAGPGGQPPASADPASSGAAGTPAGKEPFFSVPNSVRAKVERIGPDQATPLRPEGAEGPVSGLIAPPTPGKAATVASPAGAPSAEQGSPAVKLPPIPKEIAGEGEVKSSISRKPVEPFVPEKTAPPAASGASAGGAATKPGAAPVETAKAESPAQPPAESARAAPEHAAETAAETAAEPAAPTEAELAGGEAGKGTGVMNEEEQYNALVAAQADKLNGKYDQAMHGMEALKAKSELTRDIREELLYSLAELYFDMYKDSLLAHYDKIQNSIQEAMNYNTKSNRIPGALLQLGLINLRVNNLPEATAYFNILKKKYPNDENVPLINYYWGEYYYEKQDFAKAAKEFQTLVEVFPESRFVREGSMGLAKSFFKLGRFEEASQIADYIDKRWPRYYVEYPQLLRITADIAYKLGDFARAKNLYMAYYNLTPDASGMDLVMARLGDVYSRLGLRAPALQFYDLTVKRFPEQEGGLLAKMRLVENGVYDDPTISQMFRAFEQPSANAPDAVYAAIVSGHPDSPLAPVAQLKLVMWRLFKGDYLDCLAAAGEFKKRYPKSPLLPSVEQTASLAFEKVVLTLMKERNYPRIMTLWRENPALENAVGAIAEEARLALALSMLRTGHPRESLGMALSLIGPKQTDNGTLALMLAMNIYQEGAAWSDLLRLIGKARDWSFSPDQRRRVEFAAALALENLGDKQRSAPLWRRLAADGQLAPSRRAYALYYLAKAAQAADDSEKVLFLAGEAVDLFREAEKDRQKLMDSMNMRIEAQIKLGLFPDALAQSEQYDALLEKGGADWAANRFRMARVQRDMGNRDAWRASLEQMRDAMPDSLYGKMAASELSAHSLERRAEALTNPQ